MSCGKAYLKEPCYFVDLKKFDNSSYFPRRIVLGSEHTHSSPDGPDKIPQAA